MGYRIKTINDFDFFEVSSAFQKSIRRGIENEAIRWGIELFESNYAKYLWDRMFVIASEDIGLAEPDFITRLVSMKQSYDYLEKNRPKKVSKRLVLLQAIISMVHAKKSRYIDLCYSVYWIEDRKNIANCEIPDYAYDMHTLKGKIKGRGLEHFYKEGALINNANKMEKEEEFEEIAMQIDVNMMKAKKEEKAKKPKTKEEKNSDSQSKLFE